MSLIFATTVFAVVLGNFLYKRATEPVYIPKRDSLIGRNIIITGGNTGLGLASAKLLASGGANIVVTVRSDEKGIVTVTEIHNYLKENGLLYPNQIIMYKILHLDQLSSIKNVTTKFWDDIPTPIHVLMNNAGVMPSRQLEITDDGIERGIQTNYLGPFVLTALLSTKFAKYCHIINVSSEHGHKYALLTKGGLDLDNFWKGNSNQYHWFQTYCQSKLANIIFTLELQRRINKSLYNNNQWIATTLHPGAIANDFSRSAFDNYPIIQRIIDYLIIICPKIGICRTNEQGSATQVWLASSASMNTNELSGAGGKYFIDRRERKLSTKFANDQTIATRLWVESENISGIQFNLLLN